MGLLSKISRHPYLLNLGSLFLFTIFLNESFVYYQAYVKYWPSVNSKTKKTILLVADPQIQGFRDEPPSFLGALTRWDSDRYLSVSFQWLLWAYKPAAIIFLGDLMDEASTTEDEGVYQSYVDRFYGIYPRDSAPKTIFLPGDNDVGGEGLDPFTEEKLTRFKKDFNGGGSFHQVSKRLQIFTYDPLKGTFPFVNKRDSKIRVLASHRPIMELFTPGEYFSKLPGRPSVIFSAHAHRGSVFKHDLQGFESPKQLLRFSQKASNGSFVLRWHMNDNKDAVYEINVPTCSYRMGVPEMAFGLLAYHKKMGVFEYANLWLPDRFGAIRRYYIAGVLAGLFVLFHRFKNRFSVGGGRFYNIKYTPLRGGK